MFITLISKVCVCVCGVCVCVCVCVFSFFFFSSFFTTEVFRKAYLFNRYRYIYTYITTYTDHAHFFTGTHSPVHVYVTDEHTT